MKPSLPRAIRRLVLAALTPVPALSCSGTVAVNANGSAATGSGGGTTVVASSGGVTAGGTGGATGTGTGGGVTSGGTGGAAVTGTGGGVTSGPSDGGPCSPYWISGNATSGGQVLFPCGLPPAPVVVGQSSFALCSEYCMGSMNFNACTVTSDGGYSGPAFYDADGGTAPTVVTCFHDATGRRPAGLVDAVDARAGSIGERLARAAYLEAAAVIAFRDLAAQIEAHGAPAALVKRLRRAAQDEVRHARVVGALARRRGAEPAPVVVEATGLRSLLALALENAREGCVRETWGAACAVVQSERAADLDLREAMRGIARDELRHAELSWDMAAWIAPRLTDAERALVAAERARAVAELERELERTPAELSLRALGVPSRAEVASILGSMRSAVWSENASWDGASNVAA